MCIQKILFINPVVDMVCGPDESLFGLIRKIDREKYSPLLIIPKESNLSAKYQEIVEELIVDRNAGYYHRFRYIGSNLRLFIMNSMGNKERLHFLKTKAPALVHTNMESAWAFGVAARRLKIPSIIHIRGLTTLNTWIGKILMPVILRSSADHFIAVSEPVAKKFSLAGIPSERITVIDNGVDISQFQPDDRVNRLSSSTRDDVSNTVIGAVGSADPRKGWLTLVQACVHLRMKYPNMRCLFIGDLKMGSNYTKGLLNVLAMNGLQKIIQFTGVQKNMPSVYPGLDILVQPSLIEAGPRAPIEAMACGVPVVATRVGGNPDYVQDGVTGLLCDPGDPQSLAIAIDRLLSDPELRRRMGAEGRRFAIERFSLEAHTQKVEAVYDRLLERVL